jgi:aerobic-type carbon monoxide dehydrogenase small subunit (CoxS/CutS family)
MQIAVTLNGQERGLEVRSDEMLLDVLRREGLASVRATCGIGACGACTAVVDGRTVSTCLLLAPLAAGAAIETVEGLDDDPVQRAFDDVVAFQCGYCTPGMILTARALLDREPRPSAGTVRHALAGNLCRCGCYPKIVQAVLRAADLRTEEAHP